ncbi:glycosyltransferase family 2 protein [Vibrio sp. E150_018]
MSHISIIIPVKNEQDKLLRCIRSIQSGDSHRIYFIVVDDQSTDSTLSIANDALASGDFEGKVLLNDGSSGVGAGACRNIGISHIPENTDYVLFFDADDVMPAGVLSRWVESLEQNQSDVSIAQYEYYVSDTASIGMNKADEKLWNQLVNSEQPLFNEANRSKLLKMINYPWNKLLRYDFLKRIKLRFSTTPVHNDIYAHWIILLNAQAPCLFSESVCHHFVISGNQQITNIFNGKRLAIIPVLEEVQAYFYQNKDHSKVFYPTFLEFKRSVLSWAYERIQPELKPQLSQLIQDSYQDITSQTVLEVSLHHPATALQAGLLKLGMDYDTINHRYHI